MLQIGRSVKTSSQSSYLFSLRLDVSLLWHNYDKRSIKRLFVHLIHITTCTENYLWRGREGEGKDLQLFSAADTALVVVWLSPSQVTDLELIKGQNSFSRPSQEFWTQSVSTPKRKALSVFVKNCAKMCLAA